ncbi:hypothetical protein ANN_00901 [Periplaneta americana]|uniref:DUF4817 domain-containing protein n=1 Tax=Periplaneta americana TaxID=6978 RepID=A0ABQ8TS31_PERAM|nr:hypothetical protein ANN_00901 [Periplaneta americana]
MGKACSTYGRIQKCRVLVGKPEGKRSLGRPRRRWEDNIKMDLREVGYDDRDWINLAQGKGPMWSLCDGGDEPPSSLKAVRGSYSEEEVLEEKEDEGEEEEKEEPAFFIFYDVFAAAVVSLFSQSLPSKETLRGHSDSSFRGEGYIQCCVSVRLCDMYSNQELAEIHFMYGKADGNAALARRLYQERYPQRQCPDRKPFVRLHYRLCKYGKFKSPGLGRGRLRSRTPEVQKEILEAVNMTPSISTRRVTLQVNVPHTTVWRFCQWFLQQCGVNPNFPALVLFTDEAQFTRDGITNFHNQHV